MPDAVMHRRDRNRGRSSRRYRCLVRRDVWRAEHAKGGADLQAAGKRRAAGTAYGRACSPPRASCIRREPRYRLLRPPVRRWLPPSAVRSGRRHSGHITRNPRIMISDYRFPRMGPICVGVYEAQRDERHSSASRRATRPCSRAAASSRPACTSSSGSARAVPGAGAWL